jgi:two-component system, OmpR family, KDP operon response regulator KdpE
MSHKQILVIEDDADLRLGYKILLEMHNYQPIFAADLPAAVKATSEHQPDLIILDLGLPGADGFDVLEQFDMYVFLVPVIVVSARPPQGNRVRAFKAGARAYIQKPWDNAELLSTIRELLVDNEPAGIATPVA